MAMVYYLTENGYTLCSKHLDAWRPIGARLATPADEVGECADCLEEVCRCGHDRYHHAARAAIPGDPGAPCLECESDGCRDFVEGSADRYHLGALTDCPTCSAR